MQEKENLSNIWGDHVAIEQKEKRLLYIIVVVTLSCVFILVFASCTISIITVFTDIFHPNKNSREFYETISKNNIMNHLKEFQAIAGQFGNSRSVNNGYNASLNYVKQQLESLDGFFSISTQSFSFTEDSYSNISLHQNLPFNQTFVLDKDFSIIEYTKQANVTATLFPLKGETSSGCSAESYTGFVAGSIAVVTYNATCSIQEQANFAEANGAVGLIISNGIRFVGPVKGALDENTTTTIPVLGVTYLIGVDFNSSEPIELTIVVETQVITSYTSNLYADFVVGSSANSWLVIGSQLDSAPSSPGINDNGSGSAVNLEIALQFAKQKIGSKTSIRFAWWGAEEIDNLGSSTYVASLAASPQKAIFYMNYDMLGSPNFIRGVYNGNQANALIRPACVTVSVLFERYWQDKGLRFNLTELYTSSNLPFLNANIPAGGLSTGSNIYKSMYDRTAYGGFADAWYDPCYQKSCDTINNVNPEILMENTRAAAYIFQTLVAQNNLAGYLNPS